MKNTYFLKGLIFTLFVTNTIWTYAQLGVGATNFTPNVGAMLDVSSTNKGVLLPRIANTASLVAPTDGLLFYNTTAKKFNYFDGATWQQTYLGSQWNINGANISYSAGNVGIGTTSPLSDLHLVNSTNAPLPQQTLSDPVSSISISPGNTSLFIDNTNVNASTANTGIVSKVRNSSIENIAIIGLAQSTILGSYSRGTLGISSQFNSYGVYGIATFTGNQNAAYAIYGDGFFGNWAGYFSGRVTITGVLTNPSDEKLKRNMRPMAQHESMLNKLMNLKPISYDFDKACAKFMNLPTNKQFGFTAQNVEAEFPELVSISHQPANENSSSEFSKSGLDYKAVNYIQLIPILTTAIQEQQVQIEKLQKQIDLLLKK